MNAPDRIFDDEAPARAVQWSLEAEQAVLGALLIDNDAFDRVGDVVTAASFWHAPHRTIFATIAALVTACKPADELTVFEALKAQGKADDCGGLVYLGELARSTPSSRTARRYAELVAEKAQRRAMRNAADAAVELTSGDGDIGQMLDKIAGLFGQIQRQRISKVPKAIAELAVARMDHYAALERGEVEAGWSTKIPKLDELLNGGMRPGGLYILAARPKVGKSSLALALAETFAARNLPTLVLSQEMPDTEVADRAVVHAGRVDYSELMSGKLSDDGWGRAADGLEQLAKLPLYVDDQPALTITDIRAKARMVKGLKVLVLDYLQLCAGTKEDDNRNSQIEVITRGLKALAKSDQMVVLALSQLNRKVDDRASKRPMLSDLRDSGAIEQDADVILFLWPVREMGGRKIVGLSVEGNRQGRNGAFALDFDGAHQRWGESLASLDPPTATERRGKHKGFDE